MVSDRTLTRGVLAVGILGGIATAVTLVWRHPEQVGLATDVYVRATEALVTGGHPYAVSPADHFGYRFLYPPIVFVAVLPHWLLGSPFRALLFQTLLNLATVGALAWLIDRELARAAVDLARVDRVLVVGYVVTSFGVVTAVINGQVNLQLALAIALGTVWLEAGHRGRSGVAFALAASVKLFPAVLGGWLVRQRAWRALGVALVTGIGLLGLGALLFGPDLTIYYVTEVAVRAPGPSVVEAGSVDSSRLSIDRPLAALLPGLPPTWYRPLGAAVLVPVVLATYRRMATRRDRLIGLLATMLAAILLVSLEPFYVALAIYPLVPLAYLLSPGPVRRLYLGGLLLLSLPITMGTVTTWTTVLPATIGPGLTTVGRSVFGVVLPPGVGLWLILLSCVLQQRGEPPPEGTDSPS